MNQFKKTNKKLEKLRGIYFQIGLILAGGLTLVAFEWTSPIYVSTLGGEVIDVVEWDLDYVEPFEVEKKEIKEVIMKPKVNYDKIKIVVDEYKEPEKKELKDVKQQQETFSEGDWKETEVVKEPEAPKSFAQHMPHYKDCASLTENERKMCTQKKMYQHFGESMKIPAKIKIRGKATYLAFVYFEVNKKGKVVNVEILNDEKHKIPKELEREAYLAVSSLPEFIPAKNKGRKVRVLYKMPIRFTVN